MATNITTSAIGVNNNETYYEGTSAATWTEYQFARNQKTLIFKNTGSHPLHVLIDNADYEIMVGEEKKINQVCQSFKTSVGTFKVLSENDIVLYYEVSAVKAANANQLISTNKLGIVSILENNTALSGQWAEWGGVNVKPSRISYRTIYMKAGNKIICTDESICIDRYFLYLNPERTDLVKTYYGGASSEKTIEKNGWYVIVLMDKNSNDISNRLTEDLAVLNLAELPDYIKSTTDELGYEKFPGKWASWNGVDANTRCFCIKGLWLKKGDRVTLEGDNVDFTSVYRYDDEKYTNIEPIYGSVTVFDAQKDGLYYLNIQTTNATNIVPENYIIYVIRKINNVFDYAVEYTNKKEVQLKKEGIFNNNINGLTYSKWIDGVDKLLLYGEPVKNMDAYIQGRTLIFEDDFEGIGDPLSLEVDPLYWNIQDNVQGWNKATNVQAYTADSVSVANSNLVLTATKIEIPINISGVDYYYKSGAITTSGKVENLYGRIEAKIKVPKFSGTFPAFWGWGVGTVPTSTDELGYEKFPGKWAAWHGVDANGLCFCIKAIPLKVGDIVSLEGANANFTSVYRYDDTSYANENISYSQGTQFTAEQDGLYYLNIQSTNSTNIIPENYTIYIPKAIPWPMDGEIDIMEFQGDVDYITAGLIYGTEPNIRKNIGRVYTHLLNMNGYHIYAIEWTDTNAKFYVDDVLISDVDTTDYPYFDYPINLILNLALDSSFGVVPDDFISASMYVDWVRWYAPL